MMLSSGSWSVSAEDDILADVAEGEEDSDASVEVDEGGEEGAEAPSRGGTDAAAATGGSDAEVGWVICLDGIVSRRRCREFFLNYDGTFLVGIVIANKWSSAWNRRMLKECYKIMYKSY